MKKTLMALALAAFVAPLAAQATSSNGIGYTYVQLDYVNVTGSGHEAYGDGASLSGSYQFADNFHVFGSYSDVRSPKDTSHYSGYGFSETDTHKAKYRPWTLGFGYAASIGSRADWVTQASYTHAHINEHECYSGQVNGGTIGSYTFDGYSYGGCDKTSHTAGIWAINTGVMGKVTDNLIANAYIGYSNGGRYTHNGGGVMGNVYGDFGMLYNFNPAWALHGGVRVNNNGTENFSLGVRASF
jgi:hypothetical protein